MAGAPSLLTRKEVIAFVRRTGKTALLCMRPNAFASVPGLSRCLAGPTEGDLILGLGSSAIGTLAKLRHCQVNRGWRQEGRQAKLSG